MTISQNQLTALIRMALRNTCEVPSVLLSEPIEWDAIFRESVRQSVVGIVFAGVMALNESEEGRRAKCPISKQLYLEWLGVCEGIKQGNIEVNRRTAQVVRKFASAGFRSTVMKGQGNTCFYRDNKKDLSLLRSSGDIDLWVEGGFDLVNSYVQRVAPTNEISEKEIHFRVFRDTSVEVHYRPFFMRNPFKNRIAEKFVDEEADACFANRVLLPETEGQACCTTLQFNLVHQMAHIHHHLMTEGVGLRQLIDYYMLLRAVPQAGEEVSRVGLGDRRVDANRVVAVVKDLGLTRFARALMWVMQSAFGLEERFLLWEPEEKDGKFLLDEVMRVGNFGHDDPERQSIRQKDNTLLWGGYNLFYRNIRYWRFDHSEWFWGPVWRLYHFGWRKWHGFA